MIKKILLKYALLLFPALLSPINAGNNTINNLVEKNISITNEVKPKRNDGKVLTPFIINTENNFSHNVDGLAISYSFQDVDKIDTSFVNNNQIITYFNPNSTIVAKYNDDSKLISLEINREDGTKDVLKMSHFPFGKFNAMRTTNFIYKDSKGNSVTESFKGNYTLTSDIDSDTLTFDLNFGESNVNFNGSSYFSNLAVSDSLLEKMIIPDNLVPDNYKRHLESLETNISKLNDSYKINAKLFLEGIVYYTDVDTFMTYFPKKDKMIYTSKKVKKDVVHNILVSYDQNYNNDVDKSIFLDGLQVFNDVTRNKRYFDGAQIIDAVNRVVKRDDDGDGIYDRIHNYNTEFLSLKKND